MIGSRQMERLLSQAQAAGAKVVLVGDPEQLQAIEAGAAFRAIAERVGAVEITEVRRQREAWQQDATRELATGWTAAALARYEAAGMVQGHATLDDAKAAMIAGWDAARQANPEARQIMLAYRRVDVRDLNERARAVRRAAGELGEDYRVQTERGGRDFAAGDRVYFLRNERGLGVKNGTLGTVAEIAGPAPGQGERLTVRLDDGRVVGFDVKDYGHIDHGYAATVHKSQGVTVDRTHVLATRHMDRHAAYVGLSRHRERVDLHWSADEVGSRERLARVLGRERLKDTSLDYGLAAGGTAGQPEIRPESGDPVRAYAERRGLAPESEIILQGRPVVAAPAHEAPKPAVRRGKFSGLRLGASRTSDVVPEPERLVPPVESTPARRVMTEEERRQEQMERLAASYARAWGDAERMRRAVPAGAAASGTGVAGGRPRAGGVWFGDGPGRAGGTGGGTEAGAVDRDQGGPAGADRGGGGRAAGPAGAGPACLGGGARLGRAGAGARPGRQPLRLGCGAGGDAAPGDVCAEAEAGQAGGGRAAHPWGRVRGGTGIAAGAGGAGAGGDRAADPPGRAGAGARAVATARAWECEAWME